ncbi:CAF17-like 4Fe-4S cluster assembly/insertion protein YgfZ [Tepidimonas charontis]|uniref:tRNA-modifying protein YgfZ n=1 Tax=Tepidimonas charontis TaxID=2267262 RepID=A0A554XI87_9BURK|nr:folate-binding protein [Tepidimonas charontis]TSE35546.1 tRNA-modifying protein YgfZ [Tepidimonas charontis]
MDDSRTPSMSTSHPATAAAVGATDAPPELAAVGSALPAGGCAPLSDWGVLLAEGPDAAAFLHGQLTNDVLQLDEQHARLAAYCSPKGRMLMSAVVVRLAEGVALCLPRERLAPMLKRLAMFVLRAKVRLHDASALWTLWGVIGESVPADLAAAPWSVWRDEGGAWVRLPPALGRERALRVQAATAPAPSAVSLPPGLWPWLEVMSGVVHVCDATAEAFVPQMINYESVGGVNFKKGCYPGQEVVARSQFRGTLKRRGYLAAAEGPVAAGQEVFHPADTEQPVGLIAQAAAAPDGSWHAFLSLQTSAADGQPLRAGTPDGVGLRLLPLPYPLLQDI